MAVLALAGFAGGTAVAVDITGRLAVPRDMSPPPDPTNGPASFYWEEANGFLEARDRRIDFRRDAAVVLTGTLAEGERPASEFRIQGGALMPSTMVAQQGTQLRIINSDACAHELYAEGLEGFTPLPTPPGDARTLALPAPGSYPVRDRIYSHVKGHLHVIADLVARGEMIDGAGGFRFRNVPPGNYTLKVFYGDREVGSRPVEVEDTRELVIEEPVTINLSASE
jgi:hypothetical protein